MLASCAAYWRLLVRSFIFYPRLLIGLISFVDRIWSLTPAVFATIFAFKSKTDGVFDPRTLVMALLTWVWGLRLSYNFWRKGSIILLVCVRVLIIVQVATSLDMRIIDGLYFARGCRLFSFRFSTFSSSLSTKIGCFCCSLCLHMLRDRPSTRLSTGLTTLPPSCSSSSSPLKLLLMSSSGYVSLLLSFSF